MSERPSVSVVVSTRNRSPLLPRLFAALSKQTVTDFEVVIVNDGSTDETAAVLSRLAEQFPFPVQVLTGRGEGPAVGRQLGWKGATGDIIAFTDDDCVPSPNWLAEGIGAFPAGGPAVVVGRTGPNPDQIQNHGPFSRTLHVNDARYFQTANIFYRRDEIDAVGGFDPRFDNPGGEDTDLGLRLVADLGATPIFAASALVYHDVRPPSLRAALREAYRWTGVPRVVAKHPRARIDYLYRRVFWKPSHPYVLLVWVGGVGAAVTPWSLGLVMPWLWYRTVPSPVGRSRRENMKSLPGALLVDSVEVLAMIRGSIDARTFVL